MMQFRNLLTLLTLLTILPIQGNKLISMTNSKLEKSALEREKRKAQDLPKNNHRKQIKQKSSARLTNSQIGLEIGSYKKDFAGNQIAKLECTPKNEQESLKKSSATIQLKAAEESTDFNIEENEAEFNKFVEKHQAPTDLQELLEKNKHNISEAKQKFFIDGKVFYKKDDFARIHNADRMRRCMDEYQLDCLDVASKYAFQCGSESFKEWVVIAKEVKSISNEIQFTLKETQQLFILAETMGFRDWYSNFCRDTEGKIVFFDTEDNSFAAAADVDHYKDLPNYCKIQYVNSLISILKESMEPDALKWFDENMLKLRDSSNSTTEENYNDLMSKFTDPEIDFKKVRRHYKSNLNHP